jgi:hypothetical protein
VVRLVAGHAVRMTNLKGQRHTDGWMNGQMDRRQPLFQRKSSSFFKVKLLTKCGNHVEVEITKVAKRTKSIVLRSHKDHKSYGYALY